MSNPLYSFGETRGLEGDGVVYGVTVPSGTLATAMEIPLVGDEDSLSKLRDLIFTQSGAIKSLLVVLDAVVPTGSTLRTNIYNATQNAYLIDTDITAGNNQNSGSGSVAINPGDQVYLVLVDILGSGFTINRLQWRVTNS